MYCMYSDFEYSFNYLHKDKRMPSEPNHPDRLSSMNIDSNLQWRAMKMQIDYDWSDNLFLTFGGIFYQAGKDWLFKKQYYNSVIFNILEN